MRKLLTVSALALTLATLGAGAGQAQEGFVPFAAAREALWRGGQGDGWRDGRHGRGEDRFRREGRHGGRHEGGRRGGDMMRQFQAFDADRDGAVTQAEIDQFRQAQIARFDANRDGTLSLDEYQALWLEEMHERMVDGFQEHDDDGNGQVTAEEFNERFAGLVARLDRNGDGRLSPEDRGRARRAPAQPQGNATPEAAPGAQPAPAPQQ